MNTNGKLHVRQVNPDFIQIVWPDIKEMLEAALQHAGGEYSAEQLKVMLVNGSQILLVAESKRKIYGAATIIFINYPNDRIAFITAIGGRMIVNQTCWQQLEEWAKGHACTKIRGATFESAARLWKKFGVEARYIIVEKPLGGRHDTFSPQEPRF